MALVGLVHQVRAFVLVMAIHTTGPGCNSDSVMMGLQQDNMNMNTAAHVIGTCASWLRSRMQPVHHAHVQDQECCEHDSNIKIKLAVVKRNVCNKCPAWSLRQAGCLLQAYSSCCSESSHSMQGEADTCTVYYADRCFLMLSDVGTHSCSCACLF
jgi:hypothetical protein